MSHVFCCWMEIPPEILFQMPYRYISGGRQVWTMRAIGLLICYVHSWKKCYIITLFVRNHKKEYPIHVAHRPSDWLIMTKYKILNKHLWLCDDREKWTVFVPTDFFHISSSKPRSKWRSCVIPRHYFAFVICICWFGHRDTLGLPRNAFRNRHKPSVIQEIAACLETFTPLVGGWARISDCN